DRLAEGWRSELHSRLDHFGILRDAEARVLVFVIENPALALRDDFVAKILYRNLVPPLAECPFRKLLDIALVHEGYGLASSLERVLNRHADKALRPCHRDRLDANAGIEANLFLAALQHIFVEELDQTGALGCSLLPLDARVNIFGVLAEDYDVHALGMLHGR